MPPAETHRCFASGCAKQIPLRMLCCLAHWRQVPADLQRRVWKAYRPGQEHDTSKISAEYSEVLREVMKVFRAARRDAQGALPLADAEGDDDA